MLRFFPLMLVLGLVAAPSLAADRTVSADDELRAAFRTAEAGTRIRIAPGTYGSQFYLRASGTKDNPIVIEAEDPKNPPVFKATRMALMLSDCNHVTVRNLVIEGARINGMNIDDGGTFDTPSRFITLENLTVRNTGPVGNFDGIKMSGIRDFVVRNCRIEGWGGSAIDMVGCHDGLIENCEFRGKENYSNGTGPQLKGGSSKVTVRQCLFVGPMGRGVNIGGSTGMQFFRPTDAKSESSQVTVEGCTFIGTSAPVAFVGIDGAAVRYNTMIRPDDWALRILQENLHPRLARSQDGRFEHNLIVFRAPLREGGVNVGPDTRPRTFTFRGNWWYVEGAPNARPTLPARETDGTYGRDPKLTIDEKKGTVTLAPDSPAAKVGAAGFARP